MRSAYTFFFLLFLCCRSPGGSSRLICGEVVDDTGRPVSGALLYVTSEPAEGPSVERGGKGWIEADERGRFCVVPRGQKGAIHVEVPRRYCPLAPVQVSAGQWLKLEAHRRLFVESKYQVGFDSEVVLEAKLRCERGGRGAEVSPSDLKWEQVAGPPLHDRVKEWTGPLLRLRTHPLKVRSARPGLLPLSPAEAGLYRFVVRATDASGTLLEAEAFVTAASVQSGLLNVPVDTDLYLDAGLQHYLEGLIDEWILVSSPKGSEARLSPVATADGKPGVSMFRPDRPGSYEVVLRSGTRRMVIEAGLWNAVPRDCQRAECHPSEHRAWRATPHARALDERLTSPASAKRFEPRCLACHTVGWNPGAASLGFDDVAAVVGASHTMWDGLPGGAGALPTVLRRLGNVWCIACHGPGRLPEHGQRAMTVKAGVCAQCHDDPPERPTVAEWKSSRMAKSAGDPSKLAAECAGCHTAQGAVARMRGRIVSASDPFVAEPISCASCHVMHTENPVLLRQVGTVYTASGILFEAGRGAVCIGCHQAGVKADDSSAAKRLAPLASQSEIMLGGGAFWVKGNPANISPDLCIECHMAKSGPVPEPGKTYGGHTFRAIRRGMEAPEDCDGDGVATTLEKEVEGCLAKVEEKITRGLARALPCKGTKVKQVGLFLLPVGSDGTTTAACESWWRHPAQTTLYKAAYNFLLVKRDGSEGEHNPLFTLAILKRTLSELASSF